MRGQVSLEFLLIMAALFGFLALIVPVSFGFAQEFVSSTDVLSAKRAASDVSGAVSLMQFLAEGSCEIFDYSSAGGIEVYSLGSKVIFQSGGVQFPIETNSSQFVAHTALAGSFFVQVKKTPAGIAVTVGEK